LPPIAKLTPQQASERMKVSGTAKEYQGLWKAVNDAKPLDAAQLKIDPSTLPSISKVTGMVATMSEIDLVFDLVKQAKAAKALRDVEWHTVTSILSWGTVGVFDPEMVGDDA
jgi:hypothetical protein